MRQSLLWAFGLILAFASSSAAQSNVRHVLMLKSSEIATDSAFAQIFRAELNRQSPEPINFFEASLQPAPSAETVQEVPVVDYLQSTLGGQRLDLVVTLSGPAAQFAQKYRSQLFPTTPLLFASVDRRWVQDETLTANETAVAVEIDPPRVIEDIQRLLPGTATIFVVVGKSRLEQFWRDELNRSLEPFTDRLTFTFFDELSFAEMLTRSAALPEGSAIFYSLLSVDAKGFSHSDEQALAELHEVANAPIFGLFDTQLGRGIVGGPIFSLSHVGRLSATVASRILGGESPGNIKTPPVTHGRPTYDWRELRRWGISEARLPANSIIQFRQPSVWEQYRSYIVGAALLLGLQSALIAGLVVQRARRRQMELALRESEERFRLMANGAPVMVWTANPDMATDFYNTTVLEFSGLPIEQLLGDGWLERLHPDDVEPCQRIYIPAFETRQPYRMEYRFRRADGTYRWVLDTGVPRYGPDGGFAGFIGSALDITERKEMEQSLLDKQTELQHSHEQNQDLAGQLINAQEAERTRIARDLHDDLSQQLAGVAIMLSGLKRRVGKPDSQRDVDHAITTLQERTSALSEALRTLSHELHPSMLQHAGLVAALKRHCADVERHHPVAVTFSGSDGLDTLSSDVALCLFRVTQEALTNAVRHARARTIVVQLEAADEGVELNVVDDGVGFVTSERGRSGLGLRSIDERVRLARGSVKVDSGPGQGTKVLVRIPLAAPSVELAGRS